MSERLLKARELADLLGISPATVLDRFERGDLPGFRLFGRPDKRGRPCGPVRFRLSEIEEQLEAWRVNGSGDGGEVSPTPSVRPTRALVSHPSPTPSQGGDSHA